MIFNRGDKSGVSYLLLLLMVVLVLWFVWERNQLTYNSISNIVYDNNNNMIMKIIWRKKNVITKRIIIENFNIII